MALFVRCGLDKVPQRASPTGFVRSGPDKTPLIAASSSLLFFPLPRPPTRTTGFARSLLVLPRLPHPPFPTSVDQIEKAFPLPSAHTLYAGKGHLHLFYKPL